MSQTVDDGQLITKDPGDSSVYVFDWDARHLATGATITTSTFALSAIKPSDATLPTKDNPSILSDNRRTQVRVIGGTLGATYELTNTIVTNESPAQTKERSVRIKIENQ